MGRTITYQTLSTTYQQIRKTKGDSNVPDLVAFTPKGPMQHSDLAMFLDHYDKDRRQRCYPGGGVQHDVSQAHEQERDRNSVNDSFGEGMSRDFLNAAMK
jgi:hypothetical protein